MYKLRSASLALLCKLHVLTRFTGLDIISMKLSISMTLLHQSINSREWIHHHLLCLGYLEHSNRTELNNSIGSTMTFTCDYGYVLHSTIGNNLQHITCLTDGSWDNDLEKCDGNEYFDISFFIKY